MTPMPSSSSPPTAIPKASENDAWVIMGTISAAKKGAKKRDVYIGASCHTWMYDSDDPDDEVGSASINITIGKSFAKLNPVSRKMGNLVIGVLKMQVPEIKNLRMKKMEIKS